MDHSTPYAAIYGSNDGINYTLVSGIRISGGYDLRYGQINNSTAYSYYKIRFNLASVALYDWELYGTVVMPAGIPADLHITANNNGNGILTWSAATDALSYSIYDNGTKIASGVTSTSYSFSGLTAGTHKFTVSATNTLGESNQSSAVSNIVLSGPPANINQSEITATTIILNWEQQPNANSYKIYKNDIFLGISNTNSYPMTGLQQNSTYNITISAVDVNGEGLKSQPIQITTMQSDISNDNTGNTDANQFVLVSPDGQHYFDPKTKTKKSFNLPKITNQKSLNDMKSPKFVISK